MARIMLSLLLFLLLASVVSAFVAQRPALPHSWAPRLSSSQSHSQRSLAAQQLNMSMSGGADVAAFLPLLAAGNIGAENEVFKPIFIGGLTIIASGVVSAFVVATILEKSPELYEEATEDLEGRKEKIRIVEKGLVAKEAMDKQVEEAIVEETELEQVQQQLVEDFDEYDD